MGFPRQEYWSGLPSPSPGDFPDPGTESTSPSLQADSLPLCYLGSPRMMVTLERSGEDSGCWRHKNDFLNAIKVLSCLVAQSCLALYNPMDCSPPGSSVHGILQAKKLEWVAMSPSMGSSQHRDQTCISWISFTAGRFFTNEPQGKPTDDLNRVNCNVVPAVGFSLRGHTLMEKWYLLTVLTDMSTLYGEETLYAKFP